MNSNFDLFLDFEVADEKATSGVWFPFLGETRVKVAMFGNDKHKVLMQPLLEELNKRTGDNKVSTVESERADREFLNKRFGAATGKALLLAWEDPKGELLYKGEALGEYTEEKSIQLCQVPKVRGMIEELAKRTESFVIGRGEDEAKN